MASATPSRLCFLDFTPPVRQRIFSYLLAPHPDDNETVINYTLEWNWLENPSNTTFGGVPQIDLCRCPQNEPREKNIETKDHMYTRYKCYGPDVKFKNGRADLWVPSTRYEHSGPINYLRPAEKEELLGRPNANILGTCRTVYDDALPILYRGRNFHFVTGPCPRGRYQAYATQKFFSQLSSLARSHVTSFSIMAVAHEEDCNNEDVGRAYADLAGWVRQNLPSFRSLCVSLWYLQLKDAVKSFEELLGKDGTTIYLDRGQINEWVEEIDDVESFRSALGLRNSAKK